MEKEALRPDNPSVRHHDTGFNAKAVVWFAVGLVATLVASGALIWGFMLVFETIYPPKREAPNAALIHEEVTPLLQPSPAEDLAEMRKQTAEILHSYGWVDRNTGVVRIPIERAIELLAGRGLPVRTSPAARQTPAPPGKFTPSLPPPPESPFGGGANQGK